MPLVLKNTNFNVCELIYPSFHFNRAMDGYVEEACPICLDGFKCPKLLPCAHTFCSECLQTCLHKTKRLHEVQCPLCRRCIKLPKAGVSGLLTNYFCEDNYFKRHHSDENTKIDQSGGDEPESADGLRPSSRDQNYDVPLPTGYSNLGIHAMLICTKLKATLLNAFMVSDAESSEDGCMNSVFGLPNSECMTILSGGPFLVRYRLEGTESERIRLPEGLKVYDTICRNDGSILATCIQNNQILIYKNNTWSEFANTGNGNIVDISYFSDGRILIAVTNNFDTQETSGELLIHSSRGSFIEKVCIDPENFLPVSVAVNKKTDHICISDTQNHCVWILTDKSKLVAKYNTELSPLSYSDYLLTPIGISTDRHGNIFFAEWATKSLHVIDVNGCFLGVVSTDDQNQFGNPFSVHVGVDDVIWVGDREDAVVRAFKITDFINNIS